MDDNLSCLKNNIRSRESIIVQKAKREDINGIYQVVSSVGGKEKNPERGFLLEDYKIDIEKHKLTLLDNIEKLDYFYVAKYEGFLLACLIAYTKDQWLEVEKDWIKDVYWKSDFDKNKLNNFILIDKTAVYSGLTGLGIGSKIYEILIKEIRKKGIKHIFAETLIGPIANFASLQFRIKQNYSLCGFRYENHFNTILSTLVYNKEI